MVQIRISVTVWETEDKELVTNAIINLFPDAVLEENDGLRGTSSDLGHFKEMLRDQKIRDAARAHMSSNTAQEGIRIGLNKQAALVGKVNFSEGYNPLGDIEITIETNDPDSMIDFLTMDEKVEG